MRNALLLSTVVFAACSTSSSRDDSGAPGGRGKADGLSCPVERDHDAITEAISFAGSCGNAVDIFEACAFGSSIDVAFAGAAVNVCTAGFERMSEADADTFTNLLHMCEAKYGELDGTLYRSLDAYCALQVMELYSQFYPAPEYTEPQVSVEHSCPVAYEAEKIERAIVRSSSCATAVAVAEDCAFGSLVDLGFVAAAIERCEEDLEISEAHAALKDALNARCFDGWTEDEGTLGRSTRAFCSLQVSAVLAELFSPVETFDE